MQDLREFDISWLIGNLADHLEDDDGSQKHYRIMLEFARLPRAAWREVKRRLVLAVERAQHEKFVRPFLFAFPASDCAFMISALPPGLPTIGEDGEPTIIGSLKRLTDAAMYSTKSSNGVGIMIAKDGEYLNVAWSHLTIPSAPDPHMDALLLRSSPFRAIEEKAMNSFVFKDDPAA